MHDFVDSSGAPCRRGVQFGAETLPVPVSRPRTTECLPGSPHPSAPSNN